MDENNKDRKNGKERLKELAARIDKRTLIVSCVLLAGAILLVVRLAQLQIVQGKKYQKQFEARIERKVSIPGTRGNIYDRNGVLLAYNKVSNNITFRDVTDTSSNKELNAAVERIITLVEGNGDSMTNNFDIILSGNTYQFTVEGTELSRFLADVYGISDPADMSAEQKNSTAQDVVDALAERYGVDWGEDIDSAATKKRVLETVIVRYQLALNTYQKYLPTTVASDVNDRTVSAIKKAAEDGLEGVEVARTSTRKYNNAEYYSNIIGYTGEATSEQLTELQKKDDNYQLGDAVGQAGIEASMEDVLHGTNGSRTIKVDNMGRELKTVSTEKSTDGGSVYLTIDSNLQKAAYKIIEKNLSQIVLSKLNSSMSPFKISESMDADDIEIPIFEVYCRIFGNILDRDHFYADDATDTEREVGEAYKSASQSVGDGIANEINKAKTKYNDLTAEYRDYEDYVVQAFENDGVILSSKYDTKNFVYQQWKITGTTSLRGFLLECIKQGWVNPKKVGCTENSPTKEILAGMVKVIRKMPETDTELQKKVYEYMITDQMVSARQICQLLIDQKIVDESAGSLDSQSPYNFIRNCIATQKLTPAQLHLYPYSGSMVITDPNSGEVLAMVSYPGFDTNRLNEQDYYTALQTDESKPMFDYATEQLTAPGSTFKMVSSTAGLKEGVITTGSTISCTGIFTKIKDNYGNSPTCWIYPRSRHGSLNVEGGIANSCNYFFYEVGYRLATNADGKYDQPLGIEKLQKYATLYGLNRKTGVEVTESAPHMATTDPVRAAIGQSDNAYTTAGLARYVSTVANGGSCYDLTLVDSTTDATGGNRVQNETKQAQTHVDLSDEEWDAIHNGMRRVAAGKAYFGNIPYTVAGKTGTAQESYKPNHALFLSYAPFNSPQVAIATRIPYGYTSDYAAQITEKVYEYYFNVNSLDDILNGNLTVKARTSND